MKLHELKPNEGSRRKRKIVGRGPGSTLGKTSGRGENGQKSRSGYSHKVAFEGGQLPLYRRLPKRGFSNAKFKTRYAVINLSDLNRFEKGTEITPEILKDMGLIKNLQDGIKVLGNGTLEKKLTVKAHKYSEKDKAEIEKLDEKTEEI